MKKSPSPTLTGTTYTFRPEDLITLMHGAWLHGYITGIVQGDDEDDENPLPIDKGGPKTTAWVLKQFDELQKLKRRKDGTVYRRKT